MATASLAQPSPPSLCTLEQRLRGSPLREATRAVAASNLSLGWRSLDSVDSAREVLDVLPMRTTRRDDAEHYRAHAVPVSLLFCQI
ncbi:unnamed protein product [Urochloa humidicola]